MSGPVLQLFVIITCVEPSDHIVMQVGSTREVRWVSRTVALLDACVVIMVEKKLRWNLYPRTGDY